MARCIKTMRENNQTNATNHYINNNLIENYDPNTGYITIDGMGTYGSGLIGGYTVEVRTDNKGKIHPVLYFKYIKSKFKVLEKMRADGRLKRLEKAFYEAIDNGQDALGKKILEELAVHVRETLIYVKGIKHFIERDDLVKHKRNIRGGHISDTMLKDFTRVIPKKVLEKRDKVKDCFDDFVVYHYWDEKVEEKKDKKESRTSDEKQRMRDPVLFGIIKETNRLYFIADWEDELCDLTFSEMIDAIGKEDEEFEIPKVPNLKVDNNKN